MRNSFRFLFLLLLRWSRISCLGGNIHYSIQCTIWHCSRNWRRDHRFACINYFLSIFWKHIWCIFHYYHIQHILLPLLQGLSHNLYHRSWSLDNRMYKIHQIHQMFYILHWQPRIHQHCWKMLCLHILNIFHLSIPSRENLQDQSFHQLGNLRY